MPLLLPSSCTLQRSCGRFRRIGGNDPYDGHDAHTLRRRQSRCLRKPGTSLPKIVRSCSSPEQLRNRSPRTPCPAGCSVQAFLHLLPAGRRTRNDDRWRHSGDRPRCNCGTFRCGTYQMIYDESFLKRRRDRGPGCGLAKYTAVKTMP